MIELIQTSLNEAGISGYIALSITWFLAITFLILLAWISKFVGKKVLLKSLEFLIEKSKSKWGGALSKSNFFYRLHHLIPPLVVFLMAPAYGVAEKLIQQISLSWLIVVALLVSYSFLNAIVEIYRTYEISKEIPIKGYIEVIKIILSILFGIFILSTMMSRSPWGLLSGLGALTAILILVFRDSILGFVASLQLSFNNMVQVGDWIEMPKYGADGNVIDVSLHTVKVQNWDMTISTIPSYALVSDSFKNWRGMAESGGRRIKRSIFIDINSIKFCNPEMIDRFEKINRLTSYIKEKREVLMENNAASKVDDTDTINSRNLTNIGTFRAYIKAYLKNHPKINTRMTFLIRQLQSTENGVPIEIYVFTNDKNWINYEGIQSDIMDHLFAALPVFELRAFQSPSGHDFNKAFRQA